MVMSSTSPILVPETVLILKDRLKHGQNVTKILESQVDTAQQNILLLQGQVRLANETICNLKKHFQDMEKLLSKLFESQPQVRAFENEIKESAKETPPKLPDHSTAISPVQDSGTESNKSFDGKADNNKSPYAQQLRQVLDVLQDEETRKCATVHQSDSVANKECACSDCQIPQKHFVDVVKDCNCGNANCVVEHYNKHDDYCKVKHKVNGHSNSHEVSPKSFSRSESSHNIQTTYPNHCSGPCCSSTEPPTYKIVEKTTPPVHYISVHSPVHVSDKHGERHQGHCGEKCQCHAFVNYVPYGYHLIESAPGIPESIQPISPSSRRKRSYVPVLPGEEPPNLKYTKIKRIDGNKLNAQKMLQDFTKRRFLSYNPRYDLDLLIVPPPIPAFDLLKDGKFFKSRKQNIEEYMPDHQVKNTAAERDTSENVNGVERHDYDTNNASDQKTSATDNDTDTITTICNNGNNIYNDNNNNNSDNNMNNNVTTTIKSSPNSVTNNGFMHTLFKSPSSHVKLLPIIKEENIEGRKKLENLLPTMRSESVKRNGATHNQECSYSMGLKQERTMSPITVGSNRT